MPQKLHTLTQNSLCYLSTSSYTSALPQPSPAAATHSSQLFFIEDYEERLATVNNRRSHKWLVQLPLLHHRPRLSAQYSTQFQKTYEILQVN